MSIVYRSKINELHLQLLAQTLQVACIHLRSAAAVAVAKASNRSRQALAGMSYLTIGKDSTFLHFPLAGPCKFAAGCMCCRLTAQPARLG
jgi:hypothetical protein